jgi:hypothetical protein
MFVVWCLVAPSIPQRGKLEAVVILMFVVVLLFFVQKVPEVQFVQNVEFYSETNLLN